MHKWNYWATTCFYCLDNAIGITKSNVFKGKTNTVKIHQKPHDSHECSKTKEKKK